MLIKFIISTIGAIVFIYGLLLIGNSFTHPTTSNDTFNKTFFIGSALATISLITIGIFDPGVPMVEMFRMIAQGM